MKYKFKYPFALYRNEDPGAEGGGNAGGGAVDPPASDPDDGDRSLEKQIEVLKGTLEKERQRAKKAEQDSKLAQQYRSALGEIDPQRIEEIHKALELQQKHEAIISKAKAETAEEYDRRIKELEQTKQAVVDQHIALKKRLAIQRHFTQTEVNGRTSELDAFINLCGHQFEYNPETDQITKVLDSSGKEMFVKGNPAEPKDLMLKMRQGEQGFAIASCFVPYNQSSGGGLPVTGANGQLVGDWRKMSNTDILTSAFSQKQGK